MPESIWLTNSDQARAPFVTWNNCRGDLQSGRAEIQGACRPSFGPSRASIWVGTSQVML